MSENSTMWTYYKGEWREGDVRILGAASHATWLGSLVFDGARLFEGVTPAPGTDVIYPPDVLGGRR